ncbi:hypothetical protein ACLB2K_043975 [Fragaria x ananassa]
MVEKTRHGVNGDSVRVERSDSGTSFFSGSLSGLRSSLLKSPLSLIEPLYGSRRAREHLASLEYIMACSESGREEREPTQANAATRKPQILLAASGSVAAIKFGNLCHSFCEWAEVRAIATKASLHFIDRAALPKDVILYTDEDEWSSWNKIGDSVLHIELRRWADVMVIAPLSANTLAKIAGGLCDNLLTCVVRAWDYNKPLFVAPAMNTLMWKNPFTERHLMSIDELGVSLIPPVSKRLACGDYGNGAMAEPSVIYSTVRLFYETRAQQGGNIVQSAGL